MILRVLYAFDDSRQRLFPEIVIWGRLSHPNVLPALGVSLKLSSCVITEWMINGNIMDFTPKHPGVNRLRLVRPISILPSGFDSYGSPQARRNSQRIAVPAFNGYHTRRPQACTFRRLLPLVIADIS